MRIHLYSIFDSCAQVYTPPFGKANHETALRGFKMFINQTEGATAVTENPEDFSLWYVGEYDDNTGELTPQHPVCLQKGIHQKVKTPEVLSNG